MTKAESKAPSLQTQQQRSIMLTTGSIKQNRETKFMSGQKTQKDSLETQVQFLFLSQPVQNT